MISMTFKIKLAGITIEIHHKHDYIKRLCMDYIAPDNATPDFSVAVTDGEVSDEKEAFHETEDYLRLIQATGLDGKDPYSDGVYESTAIHRKIVNRMVQYDTILIHSAVVAVDGVAYAFLAKSGVGKSTHLKQWMKHFGDDVTIVNGDKPMYAFNGESLNVYGSPWRGKEGWGENISLPVKAICFLTRGDVNDIRVATGREIIELLFHQILIPADAEDEMRVMRIVNKIVTTTPIYIMRCTIDEEAAVVAYNGMR